MDRRDFLSKLALGVPLAAFGGSALLKPTAAFASPTSAYEPIYVARDYGTDSTSVQTAISDAASSSRGLIFESTTFTLDSGIVIDETVSPYQIPRFMIGLNALFYVNSSFSGAAVTIKIIPTGDIGFQFSGFNILGNSNADTGLSITNGSHLRISDLIISGFLDNGVSIVASSTLPVYSCLFENILVEGCSSDLEDTSTGAGWYMYGGNTDIPMNIHNNTFVNCVSDGNYNHGWYIDGADNSYFGCYSVDNYADGFVIDRTHTSVFTGCSTRLNNSPDTSFSLTGNSSGVIVLGGAHSGAINGNTNGDNNIFFTSTGVGTQFSYNPDGYLRAEKIGINNSVSNSNTPSGATSQALPIYDTSGNVIGYVPIYSSQW